MDIFLPIILMALLLEVVIIAHLLRKVWPVAPYVALPLTIALVFLLAVLCAAVWAIVAFFVGVFYFTLFGIMWYINPEKKVKKIKKVKKKARYRI